MTPKPPSERNPLDAELEAALADGSLLDIDLDLPATRSGAGPLGGGQRGGDTRAGGSRGSGARRGEGGDDQLRGTVVGINDDDVIVELNPRMQGVLSLTEFDPPPVVGQAYEFSLHGQKDGLWLLSRRRAKVLAAWNELHVGALIEVLISAANSGGLEAQVGPLTAFLPASQAADGHVEDLSTLIGQKFVVEVMECDPRRKRLVISRRKVQEREREAAREQIAGSLQPGDEVQGKVTRLEPFGAFVDLGGVDGMVHISQLSRKRVEKVDEVVKIGDLVRAKVLEVKQGGKRISLSMRALEPDPWEQVGARYTPETVVQGKVVRLMDFGAFVELEPGLEGLLHVSQMLGGGQRVNRPGDVLRVGDAVSVRVIAADLSKHKLSLSRLDERGAVLGSEEAVDAAEIEQLVRDSRGAGTIGTNLGSLFKKALEKR